MGLEDLWDAIKRLSILSVPAPISIHLSTNFLTYRPHIHTPDKSISSCWIPAFSYKISALKVLRLVLLSLLEALAQILSPMEYLYIRFSDLMALKRVYWEAPHKSSHLSGVYSSSCSHIYTPSEGFSLYKEVSSRSCTNPLTFRSHKRSPKYYFPFVISILRVKRNLHKFSHLTAQIFSPISTNPLT